VGTLTFTDWLIKQRARRDPVGDLASDVFADETWPEDQDDDLDEMVGYLEMQSAMNEAVDALYAAWTEWQAAERVNTR